MNRIKAHWENPETVSLRDKNLAILETNCISQALKQIKPEVLADIGCGEGQKWRAKKVLRYDYSKTMIKKSKFKITKFDLLKDNFPEPFDTAITKRCLINLGSFANQKRAIKKIYQALTPNGNYLMLESGKEGLKNLNKGRKEFGLSPLKEPFHNNYFRLEELKKFLYKYFLIKEIKFFSTYYFITRIITDKIDREARILHQKIDKSNYQIGGQFFLWLEKY